MAIVLSALAGGGVGGATSVSGSVSESYGSRTSSSESDARTSSRSEPDTPTTGITDSFKITSRLKRLGYRVKVQATREDKHCADYSDGEVHSFFVKNECLEHTVQPTKDSQWQDHLAVVGLLVHSAQLVGHRPDERRMVLDCLT